MTTGRAVPAKLLFLPGAVGNTDFWRPAADLLSSPAQKVFFGWPGFGTTPPDLSVNGIDDLIASAVTEIDGPTALIGQSMGGVIALRAALKKPQLVTHLILTVTSGGIDTAGLGVEDWRPAFQRANPALPNWFSTWQEDLSSRLSEIHMPTLLLWGDADPISPISVAQRLMAFLPHAELHVIPGGQHDLGNAFAQHIAPLIDKHLISAG